jgi:outer membrane immunogenic protein
MRKYLITAGIAAVVSAAPAVAQPSQQNSPFEGFYIGLNGGVTWSDSTADAVFTANSTAPVVNPLITGADITALNQSAHFDSKHHTGFTGGIEAGYNWVGHGGLLLGLESDLDVYDITGSNTSTITSTAAVSPPTYTLRQSMDTNWMWTIRPRVGYASNNWMLYATAGIVWTTVDYKGSFSDSSSPGSAINADKSTSKTGYTVGAGGAWAITDHISLKGEYLFQHYGSETASATSTNGFYTLTAEEHLKSHLFRAGVDYRF